MKYSLNSLPLSNSFASLPGDFYTRVQPTPFELPASLIHFNTRAAGLLDLDPGVLHDPRFVEIFSGKQLLPGGDPLAMLYAGHQFGHYVPQLGDGRAIILAEATNGRSEKWELQLKGGGQTPYSRNADGRAVLRSTIREYLCSEAMHGLGIPTTHALCLVGSDDEVYREQIESGAILTRLAPSHVRFGSFEVFFYRNQQQPIRMLADYVIEHHYPELAGKPDRYLLMLQIIIERTARLIAQWQSVGFAHGVMNTDNMSILGLTLDYGPYGFMEAYDPGFVCNHSDHHGRYAFDQQPQIGLFNVSCLAQALLPIIDIEDAKAALETYQDIYTSYYHQFMAEKLGFEKADARVLELLAELLAQMQQSRADYTLLFRALGDIQRDSSARRQPISDMFIDRERFDHWIKNYRLHLRASSRNDTQRREAMMNVNPKYILRNYMAQLAIEKAGRDKDYSEIDRLMTVLSAPFDEHPGMSHYAEPPPDWAGNIQVSCSS